MRAALIALLLLASAASSASAATKVIKNDRGGGVTIDDDRGGVIINYIDRFKLEEKRGTKFKIVGRCESACTMITGIIPRDRVCVSKKATLGFHSGYFAIPTIFGIFPWHSKNATIVLWSYYPADVQAALLALKWNGGLGQKQRKMIHLKASSFYPLCA
jgi:hypothetical protein